MAMASRDDPLINAFASELKGRRQAIGISQEELAHRAQVNRTYVAKLELGQNQPTLTTLSRLAAGLSMGLVELIEGTLKRRPKETTRQP
ncbi:MAG: helix-turn-helix domain protein [Ramlibacter sp.]|nr:helix-turn-helix domain protein [Ramlibacter sp.]